MSIDMLLGGLIVLGLILIVIILLIPSEDGEGDSDFTKKKERHVERQITETSRYSWLSPNKTWLTTKIFIIGFSLLLITPKYLTFDWGRAVLEWDIDSIIHALRVLTIEPKPFNTWTSGDILFIIVYVGIILFLVNIPLRYTITDHSISYGILGLNGMSKQYWSDVVCFDVYKGELHIWFKPPIYKPDWSVPVPRGKEDAIIAVVSQYCVRYSVKQNVVR